MTHTKSFGHYLKYDKFYNTSKALKMLKNHFTANKAMLVLIPVTLSYTMLIALSELLQYVPRDSYL